MKAQNDKNKAIVVNLSNLLTKGNAHVTLDDALKDIPFDLLEKKPVGLPYSICQIAEHIRIAQWDILEFSHIEKHVSPKWPEGYWPSGNKPRSEEEWEKCILEIKKDRQTFIELLKKNQDHLFVPFPYGDGQTLFREALVLADHNSYHTGEIVILRRLLKNWKK